MKAPQVLGRTLSLAALLVSLSASSADIFKADKHYTALEYGQAKLEYEKAAKVGNPHAYYQLGIMYQKGLGVKKDPLNALIYIALAADYELEKAQIILDRMLAPLDEEQRKLIKEVLDEHKKTQGKSTIQSIYYPQIIAENLTEKFTFDGEPSIDPKFYSEDFDSEAFGSGFEDVQSFEDDEFGEADSVSNLIIQTKPPFLIAEHDIALDGSKRNLINIQKMGNTLDLVDEYKLFPLPIPMFKGQPAEFVHRPYMGAAIFSKFTMVEENEPMYSSIVRSTKKIRDSQDIDEQYQYTMALQNFTFLEQEEGEVEKRLLALSKQGHSGAMYEYGMKLYREQRDIEEAVEWIGLAASYGLARAEYRLGKLMTTSPWVEYDEEKALFWFENAAQKEHAAAALKAAEIKVTTKNDALKDVNGAVALLEQIESVQNTNPEYYYVLALSHRKRDNRDYTKVISNLEKAIFMGSNANWDVSEWQYLLSKLIQGNVTIVE